jgi:hypothetical protein
MGKVKYLDNDKNTMILSKVKRNDQGKNMFKQARVCQGVGSEICVLGPARAANVPQVPMSFHRVSLRNLSTSLGTPMAPSDDSPASNQGYQRLRAWPPL